MSAHDPQLNRRNFLHGAASAVAASLLPGEAAAQQDAKPESIANSSAAGPLTDKEKVARIASNSYPSVFSSGTAGTSWSAKPPLRTSPYCESSPDYYNWEHEGLLYHGLNDLAPHAHTTVHAKYWDRFDKPDLQRNTPIMLNNGFTGVFALEYEAGPWDGVEGAKYLYREVMAAL